MHTNCIKNLLNLKDVLVKNIKNLNDKVEIFIKVLKFNQTCLFCGLISDSWL